MSKKAVRKADLMKADSALPACRANVERMNALLTRRTFMRLSAGALFAAALPFRAFGARPDASTPVPPPPSEGSLPERSVSLYRHAFVLDANTIGSIGQLQQQPDAASALQTVRHAGITVLKSTLGGAGGSFEEAVADIALAQSLFDRHPDMFLKVKRAEDLDRAKAEKRVGVILSFESASMLEGKLERIDLFRQLDVRVMQLTYNHRTPFGVGCLDGDTDGVTPLGRRAIERMNASGVALDLSHANRQTTADGIALSRRPPLITHAGCRAVYNHPRNKTDKALRALADKGGVMGVYMLPFLTAPDRQPRLADYMRHMVHALKVCGEDHVGIGTDSLFFSATQQDLDAIAEVEVQRRKAGIGAPGENRPPYLPDVNTPRKLEFVADALLRHGFSARVAEKVLGLNFKRAFGEIWTD